jgi:purine-nucleoside phosphorylase
MTPHNSAQYGEIAKTVLMPGDPVRAKHIAETFFENSRRVNAVRGALAFTGTYEGESVTVMASGMGMPSIALYSNELYKFYDVDTIIRVGTGGALTPDLRLRDIVAVIGASSNSGYADNIIDAKGKIAATASYDVLSAAVSGASAMGIPVKVGNCFSTDNYYDDGDIPWGKYGSLVVEMETFALYVNALLCGKKALSLITVSNHRLTGEDDGNEARENGYANMIKIALCTLNLKP